MKGLVSPIFVMTILVYTWALERGIDKGTLHCSREEGKDVLQAEKGDYGSIVSGGYPSNYSTYGRAGLWCQVHIRLCGTCRLELDFVELNFAACNTASSGEGEAEETSHDWCHRGCDHIHVYEIDPPYSFVTHRNYFVEDEGATYVSISGNLKVRHCIGNATHTDGRRFKIAYKVIDKNELHQGVVSEYGDSEGYVMSPNFPHGYATNGDTFTYMIQNLDPYGHVRLSFDDWDIPPESKVKIYDGFLDNSPFVILKRYNRPVIVSESNTLVIVLSTGEKASECCFYSGFKAKYQFVSEMEWANRPDTSCSETHAMQGGGIISFTGTETSGPRQYDCVWLIKKYNSLNTADAVVLRLREVLLGDGWLQHGKTNSLEIRDGVTSESPLIARYTARNLTDIALSYISQRGLYLRLRGGYSSTDKLSFLFTAVKNVSEDGEGCPGYFDYLCHNLLCIEQELVCDGVDHCGDGSDESATLDCSVSTLWKHNFRWSMPYVADTTLAPPPCDGLVCGTRCISFYQVCDGRVDCKGGEDEDSCAVTVETPVADKSTASPLQSSWMLYLFLFTLLVFHHCGSAAILRPISIR